MVEADVYLFDVDGTLLATRDLVHWNGLHQAMLEVYGIDTNIDGLAYHGKTDVAILRAALARCGVEAEGFAKRLPSALEVICREVSANAAGIKAEVCPSIPELLRQLQRRGKLLGVASGNLEIVGWHKVSAAGLREFFVFGSFGDHCDQRTTIFDNAVQESKRIAGSSAEVCFIGDTPDDIYAARAVGSKVIAVATGTFPLRELSPLRPDACCRSCAELIENIGQSG